MAKAALVCPNVINTVCHKGGNMGRIEARLKALAKLIKGPEHPVARITYTDGREYNLRPVEGGRAVVRFGIKITSVITRAAWAAL